MSPLIVTWLDFSQQIKVLEYSCILELQLSNSLRSLRTPCPHSGGAPAQWGVEIVAINHMWGNKLLTELKVRWLHDHLLIKSRMWGGSRWNRLNQKNKMQWGRGGRQWKIFFHQIYIASKDPFKHKAYLPLSFPGDLEKHLLFLVQDMQNNDRKNSMGNLLMALVYFPLRLCPCLGEVISNGYCHRAAPGGWRLCPGTFRKHHILHSNLCCHRWQSTQHNSIICLLVS